MSRTTKPFHIALNQLTASQIASRNQHNRGLVFDQPFPLPGTNELTIGNMAPHTAIVGSTGSGKTIIQKHLMSAILPARIEEGGLRFRALVYDPKRELYPFLCKLGIPQSQIIVTHPFDKRSVAWDLAADFRELAQFEELAEMIVPENKNGSENRFFEDTVRIIIQDVIESLNRMQPEDWDLRDICEVCLNKDYLKQILHKTKNGENSWTTYLGPMESEYGDKTAQSILASLRTFVTPFRSLAALWHSADRRFSLSKWHMGSGLLLLGADPRRERTMQRINQLLIRRICQMVLGREDENPIDLTWFFIDEIREAGKLPGLRQLMTEGRSKGARIVLGFQDIEGLYSLYEIHEAEEMVGLCANRIVLHLDNPKTRKWASEFFGEAEEILPSTTSGQSVGKETSTSTGTALALNLRANLLPIQLHSLPLGNPADGVRGWFGYPGRRNEFYMNSPTAKKAVFFGTRDDPTQKSHFDRPSIDQELDDWDEEDRQAFKIFKMKNDSGSESSESDDIENEDRWRFDSGDLLDDDEVE